MNESLGEKISWRLVIGSMDWWKLSLIAKYLNSSHLRSLDNPLPSSKGSTIWKILRAPSPLIQ
jgi:hypothetical protein